MSNTIFIVCDPRGNVCGASCFSEKDAWGDARSIWAIHSGAHSYPSTGNGYTGITRSTMPSPHDAAMNDERPYRCGAFHTADARDQCVLESDHAWNHIFPSDIITSHDAAIVAAAEAVYDAHVIAAHCPCTEGLCRHDTDAMYQDGELHDAVLAKREASV